MIIKDLLKNLSLRSKNKPTAIIAKTVKGKGVNFMEDNNDWHHGRLTKKLYKEAIEKYYSFYSYGDALFIK